MATSPNWTDEELAALRFMFSRGANDSEIAIGLGRTPAAVHCKRVQIGCVRPIDEARQRASRAFVETVTRRNAVKRAEVVALFDDGVSVQRIARQVGVSRETATQWLRQAGRDTTRGIARARPTPKVTPRTAEVKPAPADLSRFYRGRRYDEDEVRVSAQPVIRRAPLPTHVPTACSLGG